MKLLGAYKKIKSYFSSENEGSVVQKTLRGSVWLLVLRFSDQILRFAKTVILARLLSPNDFGLFGISLMVISILDSFSQTGFQQALIQKKEDIKEYLNTAWAIQFLRGLLLGALLFSLAPFAADFFSAKEASLIIKFLALTVVLQGAFNVGLVYLQKDLQMRKYFVYQFSGSVLEFLGTLIVALLWPSVWALVFGLLIGNFLRLVISYFIHPYIPSFKINFNKAKELLNFGKWILGSNIIGFFILQGDSLFIGKFLGLASLGFYQMSSKIASFLNTEIISGALFPAYSKAQNNFESLKKAYLKSIKISAFIFVPIAGGIFSVAYDIINFLIGQKWTLSVEPLKIMVWSSLFWGVVTMTAPLLQAVGKPQLETFWNGIRLIFLFILIYPFIVLYGVSGAALAVLVSVFISMAGYLFSASKIFKISVNDFYKQLFAPVFSTIIMIVIVTFLNQFINLSFPNFVMKVIVGVAIYAGLIYYFDRKTDYKILNLFAESFKIIKV